VSGTATLTFVPPPSAIKTISGDGQSGVAGSALPQPFVVELDAADGGPVSGATISFGSTLGTVASPTAVTDSLGRAQTNMTLGTAAGTEAFTAGVGTFVASVSETVTPGAAASIVLSASPKAPTAGSQTTLSAQLVDQFGNLVTTPDLAVTWTGGTNAKLTSTETKTNPSGIATNVLFTGPQAGASYHVDVASGSVTSSITLTAAPAGPPANVQLLDPKTLAVLPDPVSFTVVSGDDAPAVPLVRIVDSDGVGVPGAGLVIIVTLPGGASGPVVAVATDSLGIYILANADLPEHTFSAVGAYTIFLANLGISTHATINVTVLGTTLTKVSGDNQTGRVGQALTAHPTVQLKDANGNVLANRTVVFTPSNGGSVIAPNAQTDASGNASTEWHLGSALGTQTLAVSADGAANVTFTATAGVGPATHYSMAVSPATPTAGSSVTVTAQLRDQFGNVVPGANHTVTWGGAGDGVFASPSSATATNGSASVGFTTSSVAGTTYHLTVADGTLTGGVNFTTSAASVGPATHLAISSTAPTTVTSGTAASTPIRVQALDASNHPVSGVAITASVASPFSLRGTTTETTDATAGAATFSGLRFVGSGHATVTFSATGISATTSEMDLSPAPADTIRLVNSNGTLSFTAGTTPAMPNVIVVDSTGTPVPNAPVILAVSTPTGRTPIFADTTTTGSNGMLLVVPDSEVVRIPAGTYTVTATSGTVHGSPASLVVTVTQVTVTSTVLALIPVALPTTAINAAHFATPPSVKLIDANNQPVAHASVTVAANRVAGGAALAVANNTVVTDASGVASFPDFQVTGLVGQIQLGFTGTLSGHSITPLTGSTISLVAGAPTTLTAMSDATIVQTRGPGPSQLQSTLLPSVLLADVSGNPVPNVAPMWRIEPSPHSLPDVTLGTASASNSSGVAIAPSMALPDSIGECELVATVSSGDETPSNTTHFVVVEGPPGTAVFTGNSRTASMSWSDANNWSARRVPTSTDSVFIPQVFATADNVPVLDAPATIAQLAVELGGTLDLNGNTLTVGGNVSGGSAGVPAYIGSSGTLHLTGPAGSSVSAVLDDGDLLVGNASGCLGTAYSATFLFANNATVECPLVFSDTSVSALAGSLTTENAGSIAMHGSPSYVLLAVDGNAAFGGATERNLITGGSIILSGDFSQAGNPQSFVASDTAVIEFAGSATQHISFANPGLPSGHSRFATLMVDPYANVVGVTNIYADALQQWGTFSMNAGTTLTATSGDFFDGSKTTGSGAINFVSGCKKSPTVSALSIPLTGIRECSIDDFTTDLVGARRPSGIRPLLNRSPFRQRTLGPATSSPRQRVCATLRQLNRPLPSSVQAACRQ